MRSKEYLDFLIYKGHLFLSSPMFPKHKALSLKQWWG